MAICQRCRDGIHPDCESANCCCGHRGSSVRALTGVERHGRMLGFHERVTAPVWTPALSLEDLRGAAELDELKVTPLPVVIRTNGHHP